MEINSPEGPIFFTSKYIIHYSVSGGKKRTVEIEGGSLLSQIHFSPISFALFFHTCSANALTDISSNTVIPQAVPCD
jgi:hypothetical protein